MLEKSKNAKKMERGYRCGLFGWQPDFMQRCNNMTLFMFCYVLLCLIYGMAASYTSSMIPSIEKRFGFSSRTVGIILSMNDVSHVATALLTAHFGGRGHRPRWIMFGCIVLGIALLLHAVPEVLFPYKRMDSLKKSTVAQKLDSLCLAVSGRNDQLLRANQTSADVFGLSTPVITAESNTGPIVILIIAQLLQGVGSTALIILGLPFIDDNVQKKNSPLYFGISFSSRIFGPVLGYALGGLCNSVFLDWTNPGFKQTDPRWISAWYLGYLFAGMGLCLFAITIGCFPASVPSSGSQSEDPSPKTKKQETELEASVVPVRTSWKDLPRNVRRLVTNGAYVCRACTSMIDGIFIAGYFSFLPKFLGQQFQISQSVAAIAGGVPNVLATALGVVVGGAIMRRWSFSPRYLGMMLTAGGVVMSSALFGMIGFGCPQTEIANLPRLPSNSSSSPYSICHKALSCQCKDDEFIPVCDIENQKNFYSPCYAGCKRLGISKTNEKTYENCLCTEPPPALIGSANSSLPAFELRNVVNGLCPKTCQNLYYFVAVLTIAMFLGGVPLSGGIWLQFRIVDVDLKNMANGMTALLMAGLGYLPGPIIVGAIADSACSFWQTKDNGERGYCILYDTDAFRWKFHLFIGSVRTLSTLLDLLLTCKIWNMPLDRDAKEITPHGEDNKAFEAEVSGLTSFVDLNSALNENVYPPLTDLQLESDDHDIANTRV